MKSFFLIIPLLFSIISVAQEKQNPCEHEYGIKIHFKINSLEIVETPCDSIIHLYQKLAAEGPIEWAALGIAKANSDEARAFAMKRVHLIIDILVTLGMDRSFFVPFANTFIEPKQGEHRDWPFYPLEYGYEIGVYFQPYI